MTGWKAALVAAGVGGAILVAGYVIPRVGDGEAADTTTEPTDPGGTDPTQPPASDTTLLCVPALEAACEGLGLARVTGYRPLDDVDEGEVVIAPALDLPGGVDVGPVVARSPVAFAVWGDRADTLGSYCGEDVLTLACAGTAIGQEFGDIGGQPDFGQVKLAVADPTLSASGLASWQAVVQAGATTNLRSNVVASAADDAAVVEDLVLFGTARASVVVSTEVSIAAQLENAISRGLPRLAVFYLAEGPWVDYVVVSGGGDGADQLTEQLVDPTVQATFGTYGLRPGEGEATGLPDELGTPGTPTPPIDASIRDTLIAAWTDLGF